MKIKKVVVIGGGHGLSTMLRGLKKIENIELTAIVTVADDGGSTGRLRRRYNIPAMGDIRNVLISMAESETLLKQLMDYRFVTEQGDEEDVAGHNLGNLILTAMTQTCGSFMESITTLCEILNVKGRIVPATLQVVTLSARKADGTIIVGESKIPDKNNPVSEVFYDELVRATPNAIEAIKSADYIFYGIGSVYTSILPNLIIPEIQETINKCKAKVYYFCNAMTQPGETDGFSVEDHAKAIIKHGARLDGVVMANDIMPKMIVDRYKLEGSIPVILTEVKHDYEIYRASLLDFDGGLVRHCPIKIKNYVEDLLKKV